MTAGFFILSYGIITTGIATAAEKDSILLYTPFTKISVPPGESIDYAVDVINNGDALETLDLSVSNLPRNWNYTLKAGAWNVKQVAVLPGEKKSISLRVEVPFQVNKGNYRIFLVAGEGNSLPLTVNISEQGTYKTEFTTRQANMEGHAASTFNYSADLRNRTAEAQTYALQGEVPRGWTITFRANGKQVTSVDVEPNSTVNVTIEVKPAEQVEEGNYVLPVRAVSGSSSGELKLEAVITGTYRIELTTPAGLLSYDIVAGREKKIDLVVKNTGTSILSDVQLTHAAPVNWEVTFDPKTIETILAGKEATVTAVVKADKKAIPGDYITNLEARTPEVSSKASFRMSVKTPLLWGWIGVLIILAGIGTIWFLFRKYGRR
ncbi:MAG: hypothetical protein EP313_07235 [Bacteroidetes bacterium]|nr:MAG: hypothetical protein EP313_07235 [Bacteroidota bacterium]